MFFRFLTWQLALNNIYSWWQLRYPEWSKNIIGEQICLASFRVRKLVGRGIQYSDAIEFKLGLGSYAGIQTILTWDHAYEYTLKVI